MGAIDFKRLEFVRTEQWQKLATVLGRYDALLTSTMTQVARPVDEDDASWQVEREDGKSTGLDMTAFFNYTSQCPAISVPAGWNGEQLPVGLQIIARRYRDDVALRIAATVEHVRPWAHLRPPV
jgi:amidase/aspartyl-tRNA(Asn)/glutamyl-tRNA(Gln) amidotransferase subunit A